MSGKRLNPFQSFIVKATAKPEASTSSTSAAADKDADDEKNWVHYIDDESGFPYMYNTVTGEARWLTEAEYQGNEPAIVEIESPWETLYDNDGNIYYYNKETGVSAWEIPAEDMVKYGLQTLENQDPSYFQNIGLDPTVTDQLSSNINSMNFLEEAFGEFPSDSANDASNNGDNAAPVASSLKSIRSARSFGLKTPQKGSDLESLADQVSSQLGIEGSAKGSTKGSTKKKTQLSFVLGNKKSFKIDDSLKPSSPSKKKSKSGFEILKISSRVIRSGTDENGDLWLEYQSSDDGPIFYAKKGADGGQWRIPATFNVVELDDSQELDVAPPYTPKRDDATITPSETSLEVVDFFSVDKDDVLKIQSPSLKKIDPIQSVKAESGKEMASKPPVPSSSSNSNNPQSSSTVGGTTTTLPDIVVAKPAATTPSLQSLAVATTPTPALPPSNMELKIQSIKAEAALELEKLRKRLESAKQDASAVNTRASISLSNSLPSPSASSSTQKVAPTVPTPSLPLVATPTTATSEPAKTDGIAAVSSPTVTVQEPSLAVIPQSTDKSAADKSTTLPQSAPPSSSVPVATAAVSTPIAATPVAVKSDEDKLLSPHVSHPPPLQVPISPLETTAVALTETTPPANTATTTLTPSSLATSVGATSSVASIPPPAAAASDNGNSAASSTTTTTVPSAPTVVPKTTIASSTASITGPDGEILWDEIVPRSHLLRTTIRWECFFDAQTKFKFYRRRRDGFLQKEKPTDFDTVFMSSNSLGLSTPSASTAPESTSTPAAAGTAASTSAPAHVSFAADVAEKSSSPSNKKMKKAKKSNRSKKSTDANGVGASSFLTGVDIGAQEDDGDDDEDDEEKSPTIPKPSAQETVQLVMPTEVEEDVLQQMMRELAFVERHSSRAIRAIYQERAQLEQHDAEQLTQRLQLLTDKRLQMEESKRMRLTDRYVAGMDTDQVKRLQMRNKQLLERCYEIQHFIETSPIEHAMNEVQLLRAAILQREHLLFPGDIKHDQPLLHTSPPELLFVSSQWTQPYWRAQTQQMDKCGWFKLRHYSSPTEHIFYHSHAHCAQAGEPFDWFIRREASELKKEKWGDYEMKVSVSQSVLENAGIELYEDHKGGYVFHCPMRGTYSSNGRFDPIHFHATTGKPTNFRRKAPTASSDNNYDAWIKNLKPSIWKQLGLKADELAAMTSPVSATLTSALLASTKSMFGGGPGDGDDGDGDDRAAWPMASSDSVGDLHNNTQRKSTSAAMFESMRKLKESAQKTSHVQDTLSSLTALQLTTKGKSSSASTKSKKTSSPSRSSSLVPSNNGNVDPATATLLTSEKEEQNATNETSSTVKPIPSAYNLSILEEAFSIAKETYDPTTIMATNEELWKFEVDTNEIGLSDRGASAISAAAGLDMDNTDHSDGLSSSHALARIDVLKYEQRFDEDTTQRYQQLLIFAYQDPENPGHLLNLMEFLLQQGLNKAALAMLQRALHVMSSYEHYKPGKYEQCLLQLLRSHLSIKCQGTFTSYADVMKMVDVFPTQPFVLTAVASYFTRLHHLDWAKVLCLGALMQSPSYEMALVQLAQIAYLQGDLKHASRLLQRNGQENEHGRWSRKSKLEAAWLLEMLEADDEALVVGYKALIAVHTRDTVQSKTLLALGSLYQRMRKFRLAIDFYQRAWQMDRDDGMIPWCFATAQSVQYVQNCVIPSSIPAICVDNGGSYNTSAEARVVGDMMTAATTHGGDGSGGGGGNKGAAASERPLSAKATLTRTARPKSASATGRTNTLRPSTTHHRSAENRPLVSTSFTALPTAKTTSNGATTSATAKASPIATAEAAVSSTAISMVPSVISQLPPNKKSTATITVAEQSAKPLASASVNATWKATADALYRRSLVLMADASYHWITLLSYGDFVLASMQDTKRAIEYYEDAAKESFSTQIWPIVALGAVYQYVTNDYSAAKRLFTRALWSRHPPTDSRQRSHRSHEAQRSTLVTFGGFLRKRMKGDHGHVASASQVSSSSLHGRRTRRHVYADDDGGHGDQDEDGTAYFDGEEDDLGRGTGSMEDMHQRHRDDALRMLQSLTLSRVSHNGGGGGGGGADTATIDGGVSTSAFQRRAQDTKNLTVQEKECQVLYIAIAYLLWDMHETDAAYRYALAALKLQPTYSPALRCVGFLVYYVHQDLRLAFRYFAAAAESAFSTVDMVGNPEAGTTTTPATTSAASASSSAMMTTPRCHSLVALQTLAIVRGLRCQYDQAIAAMERVLIQSTTCRFAHRCLAVWYYHVKQHPEKALQHLHSAWELSDLQDVDVLRWKAQILMDAQAYQEARVCLLDCLRLAPYDAMSYANLAMCTYFLHRNSTSPDSCVDTYEEARYVPRKEKTSSGDAASIKRYSMETLGRIAHSRDIQAMFDVAKHVQAAQCRGSFADYQTRQARRRTRNHSPESPASSTTTTKKTTASADDQAYIHLLGGPTARMAQLTSSMWSASQTSDDDGTAWFASPHSDGRDTSSSLAYVHFLQGCLDLMLAPSLADFGLDDEDDAAEARGAALAQAKQSFSLAAVYSQGCGASSTTPHTMYPLALYHLGQIAEEENDLVTAERLMADAVAVEHIHPVTFTQLLDCITKNLTLHKQRLKELKRPYTKKGNNKKRNGKTAGTTTAAADSLLGSTFSDMPDGRHQGMGGKSNHKSSKKSGGGGGPVDSSLDWLLRQSNQGRGFLDPGMAAVVQAVAATSKGDENTARAEAMNADNDEEDDALEANSDDDADDDEDRALLADVPVAVQNRTMERCFKRVMMHTRVQEALLLRKYQLGKALKDVKLSYPKLSTYAEMPASAATGRMSQKRRLMKKMSSQQAQLQLGLPMGALDMVKSFFYVDYDWLERCLYATAKCDDWASLLQCYHK